MKVQSFFNRAVNGVYPPGSSIKPLWLAAAYQTGVTTPDAEWQDQGSIHFGTQKSRILIIVPLVIFQLRKP